MKARAQFFPGFTKWREAFFWLLELEGAGEELPSQGCETQYLPEDYSYVSVCNQPPSLEEGGPGRHSKDFTKSKTPNG